MTQSLQMPTVETISMGASGTVAIRRVAAEAPWTWLAKGWRDFARAPLFGLAYGGLFALGGIVMTAAVWRFDMFWAVLPLAAGFMLVAPIFAVGLYDTSRRLEAGERIETAEEFGIWRRYLIRLAPIGVVLMLFLLAWIRLAQIIFAIFFAGNPPPPDPYRLLELFLSWEAVPFLAVGAAVGFALAALVFAIAVISIPALTERDINVISAIGLSLQVVGRNFWTLALWAWLIALFAIAGLAALYIGLCITLPILGHASWHAYRDLVVWDEQQERKRWD